jgi:tripartite ATP-independent transporter DctP family solute receptor
VNKLVAGATRWFIAIACSAGLLSAAPPAWAQDKIVVKFGWSATDGPQDPYAVGARAFKERVEKATGGRLDVQLYPNRQIGDEKPLVEGMRLGTVDAGIITNAVLAQIEPSLQLNDLPFLFANEEQARAHLDGPVGQKLGANLEKRGVKLLAWMEGGFRNMINNVRPVSKPDDVSGVKFRVMQNPVYISMFSSLGGNAVPMAWGETFTAVQQGAIDGLEIPLAIIDQAKYYEVTKFLSITNHTYSAIGLVMSKRTFDRMPEDIKKAIIEVSAPAAKAQREAASATASEILARLETSGMKVNRISDVKPFRASVQGVYEKFKDSIGPDLMKETLASVQ